MKIMFYIIAVIIILLTVLAFAGAPAQSSPDTVAFNPVVSKEIIFDAVRQKEQRLKIERKRLDSLNKITPKQKSELRDRIDYIKDLLRQKPKVVYVPVGTDGSEYFYQPDTTKIFASFKQFVL